MQVSQDTQTNEGRHQKAVQCGTGMNAGAREQVLEHELERHLHLVSLPILCQSVHQRDVDVAHQTEVAQTVALITDPLFVQKQIAVGGHNKKGSSRKSVERGLDF